MDKHGRNERKYLVDGPVEWGTQGLLRPIPRAAFTYEPSLRIIDLAQPKHIVNPKRSVGRSAKWDVDLAHVSFKLSEELNELSKPKPKHRRCFESNSNSSGSIQNRGNSAPNLERIEQLARPKTTAIDEKINQEYQESLSPQKRFVARPTSARIRVLAHPIRREASNNLSDSETFGVKQSALYSKSECSEHVASLAFPKQLPKDFIASRNPRWQVTKSALKAKASDRLKKLAEAKNGEREYRDPAEKAVMEDFYFGRNPNPFPVKKGALRAVCSRRLKRLAKPRPEKPVKTSAENTLT